MSTQQIHIESHLRTFLKVGRPGMLVLVDAASLFTFSLQEKSVLVTESSTSVSLPISSRKGTTPYFYGANSDPSPDCDAFCINANACLYLKSAKVR